MLSWRYVRAPPLGNSGLWGLIWNVDREEGFRALYKGGPARVIRSSPQFGCTLLGEGTLQYLEMIGYWCRFALLAYETLKDLVSSAIFKITI